MTEIRSIHGINRSELSDRGKMTSKKAPYIPYTSLTKGEMSLALLHDQASVFAASYPDFPEYAQARDMYRNALQSGVSAGVHFVGALHNPILQQAAGNIKRASKQTAPAARIITNRQSLAHGVSIGETPIYTGNFDHDCVQYATKAANKKFGRNKDWNWWKAGVFPDGNEKRYWKEQLSICETRVAIEQIMNDNMVGTSPHMLYKSMSEAFPPTLGTLMLTKKLLHYAGVGALGIVSEIGTGIMDNWVETALLRNNAASGVGTLGSISSSISISPDPAKMAAEYAEFQKKRTGGSISGHRIGEPITFTVAGVTALITAIGVAIDKAAKFQAQLNSKRNNALSQVQGWGTGALEAKKSDYLKASGDLPTESSDNSKLLLIGGAAVAAYLLTQQ